MKKKIIVLDGIFIYMILFMLLALFFHKIPLIAWLWENVFGGNIFFPLSVCLLFEMIMAIVTIGATMRCLVSTRKYEREEAISLARIQMIVRVAQIPAFVIIFIAGVIGVLTIFTIGISLALAFFDLISIIVTGICSVGVYSVLAKTGLITDKERIKYSLASFIYFADVATAISCYENFEHEIDNENYDWDGLNKE